MLTKVNQIDAFDQKIYTSHSVGHNIRSTTPRAEASVVRVAALPPHQLGRPAAQSLHCRRQYQVHIWVTGISGTHLGYDNIRYTSGLRQYQVHIWVTIISGTYLGYDNIRYTSGLRQYQVHIWVTTISGTHLGYDNIRYTSGLREFFPDPFRHLPRDVRTGVS